MNRRELFAALAAAALAPGELWLPKKTFFLPPRGGWWRGKLHIRDISGEEYARMVHESYARMTFDTPSTDWGAVTAIMVGGRIFPIVPAIV